MATPDPTPLDELWFTRCPVPTATGIAWKLGWLTEEFAADGITLRTLQESGSELGRHHYDHRLPTSDPRGRQHAVDRRPRAGRADQAWSGSPGSRRAS